MRCETRMKDPLRGDGESAAGRMVLHDMYVCVYIYIYTCI